MIADTKIVDPNTGEVIAFPGDILDAEVLYRLEMIGVELARKAQLDEVWDEMVRGDISPVVAEMRLGRLEGWPGYVRGRIIAR